MTAAQWIARLKKSAPPPAILLIGPEAYDRRRVKEYGVGAQILLDLGVKDMILLTDTPEKKIVALEGYDLNIVGTHAIRGTTKEVKE